MTVNEMSNVLAEYIKRGYGDKECLITLSSPSVGARASCGVSCIMNGFDHEYGQIRIEPSREIIEKEKDRDVKMRPKTGSRKVHVRGGAFEEEKLWKCPVCGTCIEKYSHFCHSCGQAVLTMTECI